MMVFTARDAFIIRCGMYPEELSDLDVKKDHDHDLLLEAFIDPFEVYIVSTYERNGIYVVCLQY